MGASASVAINGVTAAADTSWGWWKTAGAKAVNYTFTGSAMADATPAPPPLSVGPTPKFGAGPTAIVWPPLNLSIAGIKGSIAMANMVGSSNVGLVFYGCNMAVSATTSAAAGGAASASASGTDPWNAAFHHHPLHPSYLVIALTPDFSLAPARGKSGFRLFGSFGEIALLLSGFDNKPQADVKLLPGWLAYQDVRLPTIGQHLKAPQRLLGNHDLERLFLRQHDPIATLWQWNEPPPMLAFVKQVPRSVTMETVEIGIGVSDDDMDDQSGESERESRRRAGKNLG